jgi:hypothetical protein
MKRASRITVVLLLVVASPSAQQPASPPPSIAATSQSPTFKLGVNDVDVDVVVTDKQGRAVRGLAQSDFQVFEDGRPQEISAFSAVEIPFGSAVRPPQRRHLRLTSCRTRSRSTAGCTSW